MVNVRYIIFERRSQEGSRASRQQGDAMTKENNQTNNQPAVEGLDFHGDYAVNQTKRKPFPGRSVVEPRVMIDPDVYAEIKKHARRNSSC